jgi:hypothetical protein
MPLWYFLPTKLIFSKFLILILFDFGSTILKYIGWLTSMCLETNKK